MKFTFLFAILDEKLWINGIASTKFYDARTILFARGVLGVEKLRFVSVGCLPCTFSFLLE